MKNPPVLIWPGSNWQNALELPSAWSFGALKDLVQHHKQIPVREAARFTRLRGVAVTCGRSSIISVRASLPERKKIFTLAHELGHIALGHTQPRPSADMLPRGMSPEGSGVAGGATLVQDAQREREADVWAAHLLVVPQVFAQSLEQNSRVLDSSQGPLDTPRVLGHAQRQTARCLNVPLYAVKMWLGSQKPAFTEAPAAWLKRAGDGPLPPLPAGGSPCDELHDLQAWVHNFTRNYPVVACARDYWVQRGERVREQGAGMPCDAWDTATGSPCVEVLCCRQRELAALPSGEDERCASWRTWDVVLWHHGRRWYTLVEGCGEVLQVYRADWDLEEWPVALPPWHDQGYEAWEAAADQDRLARLHRPPSDQASAN